MIALEDTKLGTPINEEFNDTGTAESCN